ncbi:MAG: AtpZ/AtpI family protein [Candidatus Roizmanbacteria bacterium]|nr:AtpZ/AtpI family protein [Candidatus Roizmanbacteria bacterium]
MKRNIIKLDQGSAQHSKETVQEKEKTEKERQLENKLLSEALGLGISLVLPIAGGALAGAFIDRIFHTAPRFTLGLLFVGLIISFLKLAELTKTGDNT